MTIQRLPHPIFSALWGLWSLALFACVMVDSFPARLALFGAFFLIEGAGVALDTGGRDTLSEVATWVQRKVSKHRDFARGWNAALLAYVLLIAYVAGDMIHDRGAPAWLALIVGGLIATWLYDHFLNPETHG